MTEPNARMIERSAARVYERLRDAWRNGSRIRREVWVASGCVSLNRVGVEAVLAGWFDGNPDPISGAPTRGEFQEVCVHTWVEAYERERAA